MNFADKKIAVIGLGIEGLTSAQFLVAKGAIVTILDEKKEGEIEKDVLEKAKKLGPSFIFGENYLDNLDGFDMIVRSPGIRLDLPQLQKVKNKIISQTKLFFELCPCEIIGTTGTKGKGTTSALIYEMLKKQGLDVYLGGNIGNPPFTFLNKLTPQSFVVLELSSFQLQDMTISPHIAVMLMVTSEHLDYHKTVAEYVDAKRNILRFQTEKDFAILNRDYPASNESDVHTSAQIFYVSREREEVVQGCFVKNEKVVLKISGGEGDVINIKDILLPGKHNLENVCAATMAATLAGVSIKNIAEVLKTFKGLEHRLELAAEIGGVKYYDDSFSTTPETAIAAIESFKNPEILILGGASKHSDFSELGRVISKAKNIKAIIGIGEEWPKIKSRIQNSEFRIIEGKKTMRDIVRAASDIAESGDVVLLTPACTSFDMFKNYKDRGEQFKKEVKNLTS